LVRRSDGLHIAVARQRRDASPWQGEAGAQRRVRVEHAVHVRATRCVALVRSCTTAPHHPGCSPTAGPAGRPTGSPLHRLPVGFARWGERTGSCRLFPTKQQRDASPWQGEAGAQRRVRVDPVVHVGATRCVALVRSCTTAPHHPGCPRTTAPPGDPPGRPYMACRKGSDEPRTGTGVAHGVVLAVVRL